MCSVNIVNSKSNLFGHKNFTCELANQLRKYFEKRVAKLVRKFASEISMTKKIRFIIYYIY